MCGPFFIFTLDLTHKNVRLFAYTFTQVDVNELDPKMAYIQITHVVPYFIKDELEIRQAEFEQNHDIDTFMFETPFTKNKNGAARCNHVEDQWKRRTVLTGEISQVILTLEWTK